jgi:hypothetical protein
MSWIALPDAVAAIGFVLGNDRIDGPVNVVAPEPVQNAEFTRVLGRVLKRPTLLPVPAFVLRLALGETADELLLSSTRAVPGVLARDRFTHGYARLDDALRAVT